MPKQKCDHDNLDDCYCPHCGYESHRYGDEPYCDLCGLPHKTYFDAIKKILNKEKEDKSTNEKEIIK